MPTLAFVLAIFLPSGTNADTVPQANPIVLENFEAFDPGITPSEGWDWRNGDPAKVYSVAVEEGNQFLRAYDAGASIQLFRKEGWEIRTHPLLHWRWRVWTFPAGSDERDPKKNDSAAALYVLFPRRFFVPEVIKYVWSEKVSVGTVIKKRRWLRTIVVRSGENGIGVWKNESRNVMADFVTHFGRRPGKPVAIGFLTDANAVKGTAKADYDDIRVFMSSVSNEKISE